MDSPIPTGLTPGLLSRATRRPAIRARYASYGDDLFASHQAHDKSLLSGIQTLH